MGPPAARSTADSLRRIPPHIHIKGIFLWCEIMRNRKNNEFCKAGSCGKCKQPLKGWTSSQAVQPSPTHHCPTWLGLCGTFWAPPLKVFLIFFSPSLYARTMKLTRFTANDETKCGVTSCRTEVKCHKCICAISCSGNSRGTAHSGAALSPPQVWELWSARYFLQVSVMFASADVQWIFFSLTVLCDLIWGQHFGKV